VVKRFRGYAAYTSPDGVVEDHAVHVLLELISRSRFSRNTYRAGRFRGDSFAFISFSGALHSVRKSAAMGNWLRNAWDAEWMAPARLIVSMSRKCSASLDTSNHIPVVMFS
jgi:hypothetical protein